MSDLNEQEQHAVDGLHHLVLATPDHELPDLAAVFSATIYDLAQRHGLGATEEELDELVGSGEPCCCEGSYDPLVAEVRRLRAILDRVFEHVTVEDAEMEAEVREIRQERRGRAVVETGGGS